MSTRQKNSKGPGGACVRRRGAPVPWHNGTMASPSLHERYLLFMACPSSPVGCRRWRCTGERLPLIPVFNTSHCLAHITSSSLIFYIHLFCGLPLVLVPVTMLSSAFAGNLELSICLTCPNNYNLRLFSPPMFLSGLARF